MMPPPATRRQFITQAAAFGGATLFTARLDALLWRDAEGAPTRVHATDDEVVGSYGRLDEARDETTGLPLLLLPAGFRYVTFGWARDPMRDGTPTPGLHDGMATFPDTGGRFRIVRNHEVTDPLGAFATGAPLYDRAAAGGTTTLLFDGDRGKVVESWPSLTGTVRNCAGGPTPWGSWLTCEETVVSQTDGRYEHTHGFVFEVPADGTATAQPIVGMGRFVHEAVAVDPATGIVYLTEDKSQAGLYRYVPKVRGQLARGGRLEMLAIEGRPRHDTRRGQTIGVAYSTRWVPIEKPTVAHRDRQVRDEQGVFLQGLAEGGATFGRLEGAWHGQDRIFVVSTDGGDARQGQVWEYHPSSGRLRLVFESPGEHLLQNPDNVCVSPRGGLVLCEDGPNENFVRGLTTDGRIFPFAQNNVVLDGQRNGLRGDFRKSEVAGVTFSPDGRWLLFNVQNPGITFAVTGPWERGAL